MLNATECVGSGMLEPRNVADSVDIRFPLDAQVVIDVNAAVFLNRKLRREELSDRFDASGHDDYVGPAGWCRSRAEQRRRRLPGQLEIL